MPFHKALLIFVTLGLFLHVHADSDLADLHAPVVQTALGSLRGTYVSVKGKETGTQAFLGVPFAKPPVDSLRLAPPQPVEGWDGEKDATQQPKMCIQNKALTEELNLKLGVETEIPDVSEDCLYLNIYTPANRAPDAKLPVMVWIHGGGFAMGAAASYDGSAMAAYEDVVVVVIQYRLGLLGLFSTGEPDMAGNFGLLDQVEALKWVQQHIHSFGGNPDVVTIYGESAGGMSVSFLHLSPLSNGLFHRGIAQSGTAALFEVMQTDPLPVAKMAANMSGCSTESTDIIRDCVKNLDLQKLVELSKIQELQFSVTVDGRFLTKPVDEVFRNHEIIKTPFMTGVTSDEGGWLLPSFLVPQNWTEGMTRQEAKSILGFFYPDPKDVALNLMIDEYTGNSEDPRKIRKAFTDLIGDILFNVPARKTINAHKDAGAPVYFYKYNYAPQMLKKLRPDFVGADHGDDLFTVFGFCLTTTHVKLLEKCSKEEEDLSKKVMKYWANFARTGSPNGDGLVHWPQYGQEENYLVIDMEQVVRQQCGKDHFVFLTETVPKISAPVVQTTLGSLRGTYVSVKGKERGAQAFLGIPFAKPPVCPALRLAPPQPVERWDEEKDASQQPKMCIQNKAFVTEMYSKVGLQLEVPDISEDCLYLNIYTPAKRAPDAKLPVMVWIHGGGFTMGAASSYDGSAIAAYEDVVVVVIQYRLGLLGFLSTGEADMAGNFGLLDQVEALKWVQQHIHNFGGNPDVVTIYGESAGGMSVSFLHLSPLSNGLFHRGIAQSGTAALFEVMQADPLPVAKMVANMSGCSTESTDIIRDCVKSLDLQKIVELSEIQELRFTLTIDGRFLTKPVDELFRNHEIIKTPFMTGVTSDEGGWLLPSFLAPQNWTEGMTRQEVKSVLGFFYPDPKDVELNLMIDEYTGKSEDPGKLRKAFTELLGDLLFNLPAQKTITAHQDAGSPVYFYEYNFVTQMLKKLRPDFVGADHGDDLFTVFGFCLTTTHVKLSEKCSKEEEDLSKTVMKYWANFARTGSPNGDGLVHWPQYGQEENYLVIDTEQVVGQRFRKKRFEFLTETVPKISAPVIQTTLGSLRGTYASVKGKETGAHAFLGVPFAKPPVDALRLAPPQPVEAWDGEKDATQQPKICTQKEGTLEKMYSYFGVEAVIPDISEDCLYLNIYTPANRAPDAKLPVMVWIHGGGLLIGAASTYDGSAMAAYEDVVVVVIQYRLGLLGFFSTGETDMAGNFGFLDQVEALKWVQQHIHNFGGNPDLVTIYGESAGGWSVSLLYLSPLSNGLFHRGIAQSGTAACDLLKNNPLPVAKMVANMTGCSAENTDILRDCVRNLDRQKIMQIAEIPHLTYSVPVDGRFLTKPVNELFRNHELIKVPFMTGVTNDECGWFLPQTMAPQNWTEGMTREEVKSILSLLYPNPKDVAINVIIDEYTGKSDDGKKIRKACTDLLGDFIFNIPALKTINAHKDAGAPVYFYKYNLVPQTMQKKRPDFVGADHGDDLFTVFGFCLTTTHVKLREECSKEEEDISKIVMKYWANFARTGSPNGDGLVHWPQYGPEENYLDIDKEQVVRQQFRKEHFVFLTQTVPEMSAPVIQTTLGSLRGTYVSVKGKETGAHAFLGIPFAKPPVDSLRLAPPQPVEAWDGEKDATQQPKICIQKKDILEQIYSHLGIDVAVPDISEDCLYLNIYTPANRAPDAKLPVMVWIHGGGLNMGAASSYDGSAMAAYEDMVVVVIQYRLGLLGFFSTGETDMAGNFGFLDQVEALKWVQQHIHNFGGNPDLVTIYGESAGGWSVSLLYLSPLSNGLFHRGIAQSGSAAMGLLQRDPLPVAKMVANMTGCSAENTDILRDCVKNLDLQKILKIAEALELTYTVPVDGRFLTKPVDELFRNHELIKVPFMTGVTNDEGGWLLAQAMAPQNWTEGMTREEVKSILSPFYPDPKDVAIDLLIDEYTGKSDDAKKMRKAFTDLLGDFIFNIPALKTINAHKDAGATVYFYEYNFAPQMMQKKRPDFVGTDHADDLFTVFGFCLTTTHVNLREECSKEDEDISKIVMKYWANFARTGSPNGDGLVHWPQYGPEENYLAIDTEQVVRQQFRKERFVFMTQTLPKMVQEFEEKDHTEL